MQAKITAALRFLFLSLVAIILNFGYSTLSKGADCPEAKNPVTELGQRFITDEAFPSERNTYSISYPDAVYLRVRVQVTKPDVSHWYLIVRDSEFRAVQTFTPEDFTQSNSRWTTRILGSKVYFDIEPPLQASSEMQIRFLEYIAMPKGAKHPFYSFFGEHPQYRALYGKEARTSQTDPLRRLGDFVGFLMSSWDQQSWCCSGVMVAPDLFLTNWHCGGPTGFRREGYWKDAICRDTLIDFAWNNDDDGISQEYICTEVVAKDSAIDFALLRIKPISPNGKVRHTTISTEPLVPNAQIVIVHHPLCEQKQISRDCSIVSWEYNKKWREDIDPIDRFTHQCDTEGGSSGAPVFNVKRELVGLHHHGFDVDPETCKSQDRLNKGVRIDKIIEFLHTNELDNIVRELTLR